MLFNANHFQVGFHFFLQQLAFLFVIFNIIGHCYTNKLFTNNIASSNEIINFLSNLCRHFCIITILFLTMRFILQTWKIGTLAINEDFLTVLEITVFQIRFRADFLKIFVIVMDAAVNAMGIFCACKEILLDAFGAGVFLTIFANRAFSNLCRVGIRADGAVLVDENDFVLKFLSHYDSSGY